MNMKRKLVISLSLLVVMLTLLISISFAQARSSYALHAVFAQGLATSTPNNIVNVRSGPQAAAFSAIVLENDSVRRLFSCKISPATTSQDWAFSAQGRSAFLYSGAKLTVDPSSIGFVEAQPTLCTGANISAFQGFAIGPDGKYYQPGSGFSGSARGKKPRLIIFPVWTNGKSL